MPVLHSSDRCKQAIPEVPVTSFRRPRNLKDHFVHSTLRSLTICPKGFNPCLDCLACRHCKVHVTPVKHTVQSQTFTSTTTKTQYPIKHSLDCSSHNVIYLITCPICHKQYVGETGRKLKTRLAEHCADTRLRRDKPVGKHFNLPGHSAENIHIMAIDRPYTCNTNIRKTLELHWVHTLQTVTPQGINIKSD
jgi:hypothetical protein